MLNDMGGRPRVADTVRRAFRATGMSAGSNWPAWSSIAIRIWRATSASHPDQLHPPRTGVAESCRAPGFPRIPGRTRRHARALNAARGAKLHALFARIAWDGCGFGA
jgi:hypothetical protein